MRNSVCRWVFVTSSFALPAGALAVQDCELNGQHVNPANGGTTEGKTGIMKCRDRDSGKLVREEEYRNGRSIGYRKFIEFSGDTIVSHYNERGNRDGESKRFDASGTLLAHERYADGSTAGAQAYFHKNSQVKRRSFDERGRTLASIEYNERGQLTELRCADKPLLQDDRKLCGFEQAAEVDFHNSRGDVVAQGRYENGKRVAIKTFSDAGTVARTEDVKGDRKVTRSHFAEGPLRLETTSVGNRKEHEREYAANGQAVRESRWLDGRPSEETHWYLNGNIKSKTRWQRDGAQVLVGAEEFWDSGLIRARTVRDERVGYVGVQQGFDEAGVLVAEESYEKGVLTRRKLHKAGRLVLDEQYHADGSRK